MYCRFFGFIERPFDVTPNPKFLYPSPGHREMLATLLYGIRQRRGSITIMGEAGTGKTTLLRSVQRRLNEKTKVAYIFNTAVSFDQMLTMVLFDLGLSNSALTPNRVAAFHRLNAFAIRQLNKGGNVVIIVDEAQNLDVPALEGLRLLSNLETSRHKLIQIILSGQPELEAKLRRPEMRQLVQRINMKRYISPLTEPETYSYLWHRLRVAKYRGPALFSVRAQKLIWEFSEGIPRNINTICDNALLVAYALRQRTIETTVVKEAIKDLRWGRSLEVPKTQPLPPVRRPQQLPVKQSRTRWGWAATVVLAFGVLLFLGLFIGHKYLDLKIPTLPWEQKPTQTERIRSTTRSLPPSMDGPVTPSAQAAMLPDGTSDVSVEEVESVKDSISRQQPKDRILSATVPVIERLVSSKEATLDPVDTTSATTFASKGKPEEQAGKAALAKLKREVAQGENVVIQLGAFRERDLAIALLTRLHAKGYDVYLDSRNLEDLGTLYRVRLRGSASETRDREIMAQLEKEEGITDSLILIRGRGVGLGDS